MRRITVERGGPNYDSSLILRVRTGMQTAQLSLRIAISAAVLALGATTDASIAGEISVHVLDRNGAPVPEVAVYAVALEGDRTAAESKRSAIMNQHGLAFEPHVLIVETGTEIEFPNQDEVRHHVYSFSPARKLDLHVASGSVVAPLAFNSAGVVTLGCNIHDDMLAYIIVVDTPHFASTDAAGTTELGELPPGRYQLNIWTPRVAPKQLPAPVIIDVATSERAEWRHQFDVKLYPAHQHSDTSLHWTRY